VPWQKTIAISLLLAGCASHKPVTRGKVVVPNECIQSLNKTPETWCEISDKGELQCHNATITRVVGCEKFQVVNPKTKGKS
jgi:hypothetical protein